MNLRFCSEKFSVPSRLQVQPTVWQARRRTCSPWRKPGTTSCLSTPWSWCRPTRPSPAFTWATSLTRSSLRGPWSVCWSSTSRGRSSPASTPATTLRRSVHLKEVSFSCLTDVDLFYHSVYCNILTFPEKTWKIIVASLTFLTVFHLLSWPAIAKILDPNNRHMKNAHKACISYSVWVFNRETKQKADGFKHKWMNICIYLNKLDI